VYVTGKCSFLRNAKSWWRLPIRILLSVESYLNDQRNHQSVSRRLRHAIAAFVAHVQWTYGARRVRPDRKPTTAAAAARAAAEMRRGCDDVISCLHLDVNAENDWRERRTVKAPITSKTKHAIKPAIKNYCSYNQHCCSCNKSPVRLAQLLQTSWALFFFQPMTAYRLSRRWFIVRHCWPVNEDGGGSQMDWSGGRTVRRLWLQEK